MNSGHICCCRVGQLCSSQSIQSQPGLLVHSSPQPLSDSEPQMASSLIFSSVVFSLSLPWKLMFALNRIELWKFFCCPEMLSRGSSMARCLLYEVNPSDFLTAERLLFQQNCLFRWSFCILLHHENSVISLEHFLVEALHLHETSRKIQREALCKSNFSISHSILIRMFSCVHCMP